MDRIIAPGTVAAGSADVAPATGTPGYATDGNPATNTPATLFPAYAFNAVQEELIALISGGNLTPDRTRNNQVLVAIQALMQMGGPTYAIDTGAINAIVAALTPAPTTLTDGMVVRIKIKVANNGNTTLNLNGLGATPTRGLAGLSLQGGELSANGRAVFMYSATAASWILLGCENGALQIPAGTKTNQAVNLGQFPSNLASNGYSKLPNGAIEQWGQVSTGDGSGVAVVLPVSYTSASYAVSLTVRANTASAGSIATWSAVTASGFSVYAASSGLTVSWIAKGY